MSYMVAFLLFLLAGFAGGVGLAEEPAVLDEPFENDFALDWEWIRHDPDSLSLDDRPGELVITTQAGTIYSNLEKDFFPITRNIALLKKPITSANDFVATLHISEFDPVFEDQEVAIVLYQSDDSYFKLAAKCGDDDTTTHLRAVAEKGGGCTPWFQREQVFDGPFWLRLSRREGKYAIHYSNDGDMFERLRGVGFTPVDPKAPLRLGFYATNGSESAAPTDEPIKVAIESFVMRVW